MRTLSPAHATALVLSLAAGAATAAGMATTATAPGATATTSAPVTTATTTAPVTTATTTAPVTTTTTTTPLSTDTGGTPSQATFGRDTAFGNDSGNTALGTSPGQTSSGTLAGNSAIGIPAGSDTLTGTATGTGDLGATTVGGIGRLGNAVVVPDAGVARSAVAVNVNPSATSAVATRPPTPVFDDAARRGMEQVQRQARSGRVYGQAPRTDNDRTDQMPDDPIIRY